jgi:hypothetical protein
MTDVGNALAKNSLEEEVADTMGSLEITPNGTIHLEGSLENGYKSFLQLKNNSDKDLVFRLKIDIEGAKFSRSDGFDFTGVVGKEKSRDRKIKVVDIPEDASLNGRKIDVTYCELENYKDPPWPLAKTLRCQFDTIASHDGPSSLAADTDTEDPESSTAIKGYDLESGNFLAVSPRKPIVVADCSSCK